MPAYIEYPDGSTYTFGYDPAGRLASVTYPGGGEVSYSHSMVVQCSPSTIIESFTQTDSLDGSNSWLWRYNNSSGGNETLQMDPYGNSVVVDFDSAGNVTEQDTYSGAGQVASVLVSGSAYSRTWTTQLHAATDLVASHTQVIDPYGFTTSTSDTDWGSGSPGAVLRQTTNGYTAVGYGEVLTSTTVADGNGNGNELAKTTWTLDSHGNPLSETDYVTSSGATALTTNFSVNGNGTIHTITEPNSAVTTFGYACGTGFFPSSVETVVGTTTAAWDCNGGAQTSSTDLNNKTTSATYDAMWRPTAVTRADASVVNVSYPSSGNSFLQSERWISASGTSYDDEVSTLDGLGRPILRQLRQATVGSSFDTVQTCYDAMSRPYFVTVPYSGSLGQKEFSACPTQWTAGGSFTTYDGLSRPIKVVDGGGGEADYAYNQNDTLSRVVGTTGGPTVSRQEQFDGLGRLQSVCEITAGTGTGGNWPGGGCGQTYTSNGTLSGYLTTYANSYSSAAQGPLTTVTQNAQSGNPSLEETRTLQYDQLGRLTAEANPETEQHAYTYTYDSSSCGSSAGDLVERQDPNGNTTCYSRDAAHRVTEISYSGPNASATDNKYFVYGTSTSQLIGCCNVSNILGRLAEAYTSSPSNHKTDEVFSYSSLGQPVFTAESTPSSGGWYQVWEAYYPDGAPQSVTLENNLGQALIPNITYYVDGEGRPTGVTDGSAYPPVTAAKWLPYGLQSMTFGSTDGDTDKDTYSFAFIYPQV